MPDVLPYAANLPPARKAGPRVSVWSWAALLWGLAELVPPQWNRLTRSPVHMGPLPWGPEHYGSFNFLSPYCSASELSVMIGISMAGIGVSLFAVHCIRRSGGLRTGRYLAVLGLGLNVAWLILNTIILTYAAGWVRPWPGPWW